MRARSAVVTRRRSGIDLRLADPVAERLGTKAQLAGDPAHRTVALAARGVGTGLLICHGSIFLQSAEPPSDPVRFKVPAVHQSTGCTISRHASKVEEKVATAGGRCEAPSHALAGTVRTAESMRSSTVARPCLSDSELTI